MGTPHTYLVPIVDLPKYGLAASFLDQFKPQTLQVSIVTGGALGTMQFAWKTLDEADYSATITSPPGAGPYVFYLDVGFTVLTFPAGTYVLNAVYTIATDGTVINTGGGPTATAARYDLRDLESQATTDMCLGWMRPAVVTPLVTWGSDIKKNYALVIDYMLKSKLGMAPLGAAVGDENVRKQYEDARDWFKAVGTGEIKPSDPFQDSSISGDTPSIELPLSDSARNW